MSRFYRITLFILLAGLALSACDAFKQDDGVVPTLADLDSLGTATFLTENAPPVGFDTVSFPSIDDKLEQLTYSHAIINVTFDGAYDDTQERTQGAMNVDVFSNELLGSRRVIIEFEGDVFSGGSSNLEATKISNSYYMINPNNVCITDAGQINQIANLRAGQIVGGVQSAGTTSTFTDINGYQAWQYGFSPEAFVQPQIQTSADLDLLTGELWVAPEFQVVVRYVVEMNVQNAVLLFGNRPVTGRLRLEYNVSELNEEQNISVPNGC